MKGYLTSLMLVVGSVAGQRARSQPAYRMYDPTSVRLDLKEDSLGRWKDRLRVLRVMCSNVVHVFMKINNTTNPFCSSALETERLFPHICPKCSFGANYPQAVACYPRLGAPKS